MLGRIDDYFDKVDSSLSSQVLVEYSGKVVRVTGSSVEADGPMVNIGDVCKIYPNTDAAPLIAEVAGINGHVIQLTPYDSISGIGSGNRVVKVGSSLYVPVSESMRGRVLDGFGQPMDGRGPIVPEKYCSVEMPPPNPMSRRRVTQTLALGVRAIDAFLTMGMGQRMGIFAGSGVGKSTLLGMIARGSEADINVIVLVGERGREVLDFIERDLGPEGMKRSVLVVSTSDKSAVQRSKCAMVGTTIAEFFRDKGYNVLLMMDSLTRYAMARREIDMAVGEPPVSRGYTPSVFASLPRLLERAGNAERGSITAIYTVLVDGDDMNEPISDAVRGILDGHIVLSRKLANANHYPPIDILSSVSRVMPEVVTKDHYQMASQVRDMVAQRKEAESLLMIGAYKAGTNPQLDRALKKSDLIQALQKQAVDDACSMEQIQELLHRITGE